jgi:hypothetical protein
MKASPPNDYSAYLAEHNRKERPGQPLGLEAYLLLREKLDELTLLELQEGMVQGMDQESLETLNHLAKELLEENPSCPSAHCGEEILSILFERESLDYQQHQDLSEASLDSLEEWDEEGSLDEKDLLFGTTPPPPASRQEKSLNPSFDNPFSSNQPLSPRRVPDSRMRRELWRINKRRQRD